MSNDFYNSPTDLVPQSKARAVDINTIDGAIDAAFDKLPSRAALFTNNAGFSTDTGGQNALTFPVPLAVTALADGMQFRVKLANSITGAAVATVGALGTFPVRRNDGSALSGELLAGQIATLTYQAGVLYAHVGTTQPQASGGLPTTGGTMTGALNRAKGAAIPSTAALDLQSATGNLVHVTGTTQITSVILAPGADREVIFDGVLTLTNSAALALPGAANIITKAGDRATFYGDTVGNVIVTKYQRADGNPVAQQHGLVPIGAMIAFDSDVQGSVYTTGMGETYLKTGVIADAAAYPNALAGQWASTVSKSNPGLNLTATATSVVSGNGVFVAAQASGYLSYSTDGAEWTSVSLPYPLVAGSYSSYVAFGNGMFIAYCCGYILRSTDGINWSIAYTINAAGATGHGVAYGAGLFVVIMSGVTGYYTSPDGVTWTPRTLPSTVSPSSNTQGTYLIYGGAFVAISTTGTGLSSGDGLNWTARTLPAATPLSIAYGNAMYVITYNAAASANTVYSSPDLVTWSARGTTQPTSTNLFVAFILGKFVIPCSANAGTYSTNGTAWSAMSGANTFSMLCACASPDGTYAIGFPSSSSVFYRLNSGQLSWMFGIGSQTYTAITQIEWCNDRFVATSFNSTPNYFIEYSWDGKIWWRTDNPAGVTTQVYCAYFAGKFYAFPTNTTTYYTSLDGFTWTTVAGSGLSYYPNQCLAIANGRMYTMQATNFSYTNDGTTWANGTIQSGSWSGITYGNGVYMAYDAQGTTGSVSTSADGLAWTARANATGTTGLTRMLRTVFASGYFVTATTTGLIYKSADAVNWTKLSNYVYGYQPTAFTALDSDGTNVVFTNTSDASIVLWNGAANDPLYRRGIPAAMRSVVGPTGFRCNPAGLFTGRTISQGYAWGQFSAVQKVCNDINYKTYDALNVARTDFYKRVA